MVNVRQISGYPNNGQQANVSRDTTIKELLEIEGIKKDDFKCENISLIFGPVSHLQYAQNMFHFPTMLEMDQFFKKKLK